MKQCIVAMALFAGVFIFGCQAEVVDEPERLGEVSQEINCVAQCAREFRACVNAGNDRADCEAAQDFCTDVCDEQTCEPGEPGCCQGQPTCW